MNQTKGKQILGSIDHIYRTKFFYLGLDWDDVENREIKAGLNIEFTLMNVRDDLGEFLMYLEFIRVGFDYYLTDYYEDKDEILGDTSPVKDKFMNLVEHNEDAVFDFNMEAYITEKLNKFNLKHGITTVND